MPICMFYSIDFYNVTVREYIFNISVFGGRADGKGQVLLCRLIIDYYFLIFLHIFKNLEKFPV